MRKPELILKDVVNLVKRQGGRCISSSGFFCAYENGDMVCGHSMAVQKKYRHLGGGESASSLIRKTGDYIHYSKYRGYTPIFWNKIQNFHDLSLHWDIENNLTEAGKCAMGMLLKNVKDHPSHYIRETE